MVKYFFVKNDMNIAHSRRRVKGACQHEELIDQSNHAYKRG